MIITRAIVQYYGTNLTFNFYPLFEVTSDGTLLSNNSSGSDKCCSPPFCSSTIAVMGQFLNLGGQQSDWSRRGVKSAMFTRRYFPSAHAKGKSGG